jgi:hypothetical protein
VANFLKFFLRLFFNFILISFACDVVGEDQNGIDHRMVHSTPTSPHDRQISTFEVVGSAESLVGRVSISKLPGSI